MRRADDQNRYLQKVLDMQVEPVISVPEHARNWSIFGLKISTRLFYAMGRAGFRVLGDLDGRAFNEVLHWGGCGPLAVEELRNYLRAVREGRETYDPDALRPMPYPPQFGKFDVPPEARDLNPLALPVSVRLRNVFQAMGITRLGQLDGLPFREVDKVKSCGKKTLEELYQLLDRLRKS